MPRFVILEHDHPELHWDLMLETGETLRTWRLALPPSTLGQVIDALALPAHRLEYLGYEGPVSGGRGNVKRWDAGVYEEAEPADTDALHLVLQGMRLCGAVRLTSRGGDHWAFEWHGVP
jgi:hypothetical protein